MHARIGLRAVLAIVIGTAIGASPKAASAEEGKLHKAVPAGGGAPAIDVRIDAGAGVVRVRRCASPSCNDAGGVSKEIPIAIDKSRIDAAAASIDVIPIGDGKSVARVRVPDRERKDLAFEAVVAGGVEEPIFSGLTGYTRGDEGDRSGQIVLVHDRDGQNKFVIVAESREDTRICGQATTPLGARGLDSKSMRLLGATLHRIDKKTRDGAQRVIAQANTRATPPLARVLQATGGTAPNAAALTDGKIETTWSEQRGGDGHGEFVTMRSAAELPLHGLVVTVAPPSPKPEGAAPRTFFIATDSRLHQVTMPEDAWSKPGATYEIPFPEPVKTTCLAIVLDEAYARTAAPEVSIAEVAAITKFDVEGAKLDDVAKALAGARADESAALLRRAGDDGLAAVVKAYATLDARGRALAVDVASSAGTCDGPAADLLTRALTDKELEVRKRALGRIERCGKNAADALVAAVRSDDEARRAAAAPLLATVAPNAAIEPLADQMGKGSPETRRAVRSAFARAAGAATHEKLLGLLTRREVPMIARLDLLRAAGARLPDLRPEGGVAIMDILRASPDMPTRYLLAQPLAHLARAPDAKAGELSRLAELARRDPDWPVRARAVELSAGIGPMLPTIVAAVSDPEPRVREAALKAIASAASPGGTAAAAQALAKDEWTFVRTAAADALGALAQDPIATSALVAALSDPSPRVRASAIAAFGKQRATAQAAPIRERLDDPKEDPDVRALAARTLGAMCIRGAADRLTELAHRARSPVDEADDRIGIAAIDALGALHPADLEKRLAPLREKNVRLPVRRAADRALSEPTVCR
ncbi:MAG: HEAT repeat domain-containing protein [Labilithrix sp.]|nr:HEAT repeat domain-containing protein [Labilithrix sp.]